MGAGVSGRRWAGVHAPPAGNARPSSPELEIPLSFSYTPTTGLQTAPLLQEPPEATLPTCEWQRRLGDFHRSASDDRAARLAYQTALTAPTGTCLDSGWQDGVRQAVGAVALRLGERAQAATLLDGLAAPEAAQQPRLRPARDGPSGIGARRFRRRSGRVAGQ